MRILVAEYVDMINIPRSTILNSEMYLFLPIPLIRLIFIFRLRTFVCRMTNCFTVSTQGYIILRFLWNRTLISKMSLITLGIKNKLVSFSYNWDLNYNFLYSGLKAVLAVGGSISLTPTRKINRY